MDFIEVEIIKWEDYNPRKDFIKPRWFALNNRILEDAMIYCMDPQEFKAWIYVLCQASQRNSRTVQIYFEHASRVSNVSNKFLLSAIDRLEKANIIQVLKNPRTSSVRECTDQVQETNGCVQETNSTLHYSTLHNRTKQYIAQSFDFAEIYFLFPKKVGKEKGIKICQREIKTLEEFEMLRGAVLKYKAHVEREGTEAKYIKHFSTFMNCWRDWLDADVGSANVTRLSPIRIEDILGGDDGGGAA